MKNTFNSYKKIFSTFVLLALLIILVSCTTKDYQNNPDIDLERKSGAINDFELIGPENEEIVYSRSPLFSWDEASNAEVYTLVIALDSDFEVLVLRKTNLSTNSFQLRSTLKLNTTYYWKVIASNQTHTKESDVQTFSCTLVGEDAETIINLNGDYILNEVGFPINYEVVDNKLHLDWESNNIGWGVIGHYTNVNLSASNAILVRFSYDGDPARLMIRLLEDDSDLWVAEIPIKYANGVEQVAVIPFELFNIRQDESFGDGQIHLDYVQRLDLVAESYSQGALVVSEIKSVNSADYIDDENLSEIDFLSKENYMINPGGYPITVDVNKDNLLGNQKDALVLSFNDDIQSFGWGVASLYVDRSLVESTALSFEFKSTGYAANYIIRLVEADQDMWVARFTSIPGLTQQHIIKYSDLSLRADESSGDGVVQLDHLIKIEFVVENSYGAGQGIFSNIKFIEYQAPEEASFGFHQVFNDNMVLQRNKPVRVSGFGIDGENLTVTFNNQIFETTVVDSKWEVLLPAMVAGGDYTISVTNGILEKSIKHVTFGDVYLFSGQSNMFFKLAQTGESGENNSNIRIFFQHENPKTTPQDHPFNGYWQAATIENSLSTSAVGWYVGKLLEQSLDIPIGIIQAAVGGTFIESWLSDTYYQGNRADKHIYYNGMIAPIMHMDLAGVIWYQGENNVGWPYEYNTLLENLIENYRDGFNDDELPFFIVSLPIFNHPYNWGYLREIQTKVALENPNVYVINTLDNGDVNDIHPTEKYYIGERLANLILKYVNGIDNDSDMPYFESYEVVGHEMILSFVNADGLYLTNDGVSFEIAGSDGIFYPAHAEVISGKVVLTATEVSNPLYARYAFSSVTTASLFNGNDLPVNSFRTYETMENIAVTLNESVIDQAFYDGNNRAYTLTVENQILTVNYNNQKGHGWGIVRVYTYAPISGGSYLMMNISNTGDATLSVRLAEVDGDQWQAKLIVENGIGYVKLENLVWLQGWGDHTLDVNNLIEFIDIIFENNYGSGVLTLSGIKISEMNVTEPPMEEIIELANFDDPTSITNWVLSHEYGQTNLAKLTHKVEEDRTYVEMMYAKQFGNSIYSLEIDHENLSGDYLSFELKGDSQAIFFMKIKDINNIIYSIQINQPISEWKTYNYHLASLLNDQGNPSAILKAENIISITIQIQDWSNGPAYATTSLYFDSLNLYK